MPASDNTAAHRSIIERSTLTERLDEVSTSDNRESQLVAIIGEGGSGKTETIKFLLSKLSATDAIVANRVIDFYHTRTHTDEGFMAEVVDVLDDSIGSLFSNYKQEKEKLDQQLLAGEIDNIFEQRKALHSACIADLTKLAESDRVVIACDTAEKLVYSPPKPFLVTHVGEEQQKEIDQLWHSMITKVAQIPNVLFIVAGRENTKALLEHELTPAHTVVEIPQFTLDETKTLLKQLKSNTEMAGNIAASQLLEAITPYIERIHEISRGRPIYLSLMIDQVAMGRFPSIFDPKTELPAEIAEAEEKFERYFVKRLKEEGSYWSDIIIALGRLKKGASASLVAKLIAPQGEESDVAKAKDQLRAFEKYAFIKVRPADGRLFLHDSLYELLDRHLYGRPGDNTNAMQAYSVIDQYYTTEMAILEQELDRAYEPLEDRFISIKQIEETRDQLTALHARRREMLAELLYYWLRRDPIKGFLRYYRYMREAILSNDTELDKLLQIELATFLDEKPNLPQELRKIIDAVLLIRGVVRAWSEGNYERAVTRAKALRKGEATKQYFSQELANSSAAILNAWEGYARILRSEKDDVEEAERLLSDAINWTLESSSQDSVDEWAVEWRRKAVLAFASRVRGYQRWANHFMEGSEKDLQAALLLWRELNLKAELATTLNDLGFTQAERSNTKSGLRHVREALAIRQSLSNRSTVALSYNTLGVIRLMEGNYDTAIAQSTVALRLGRALDNRRVQCLALTNLAEAHRRTANSSRTKGVAYRWNLLIQSHCLAEEAVVLADMINEPLRQVKALIEAGCALRDMAQLLTSYEGAEKVFRDQQFKIDTVLSKCNPVETLQVLLAYDNVSDLTREQMLTRIFDESNKRLRDAQKLAESSYQSLALDAAVNRAWLHFYAEEDGGLKGAIDEARNLVPNGYEFDAFRPPTIGGPSADHGIWRQLGKLSMLEGVRAYQDSTEIKNPTEKTVMVNNWLKSLEYSTMAGGSEHRDVKRAESMLYSYMAKMPMDMLRFITEEVKRIKRRYSMSDDPAIEVFMKQSGFWYP